MEFDQIGIRLSWSLIWGSARAIREEREEERKEEEKKKKKKKKKKVMDL